MRWLKAVGIAFVVLMVVAIGFKVGDWWRDRKSSNEIADLKTQLSKTRETLEVQEGLYLTETVKTSKLERFLNSTQEENVKLLSEVDRMRAQLLTANQLTLKWKKAYEAILDAQQSEEDPPDPGSPLRKRVDFTGKLGPIQATGYTLTDPATAFLKLEQVDPLRLTIAVAQNKDGSWSTLVASSDENVDVKVDLAGVNPLVISPKWYQRIWLDLGASALGDPAGYVGMSWRGDRYSIGAMCYAAGSSMTGCGATLGVRVFK